MLECKIKQIAKGTETPPTPSPQQLLLSKLLLLLLLFNHNKRQRQRVLSLGLLAKGKTTLFIFFFHSKEGARLWVILLLISSFLFALKPLQGSQDRPHTPRSQSKRNRRVYIGQGRFVVGLQLQIVLPLLLLLLLLSDKKRSLPLARLTRPLPDRKRLSCSLSLVTI